jgi:hypothetical protein
MPRRSPTSVTVAMRSARCSQASPATPRCFFGPRSGLRRALRVSARTWWFAPTRRFACRADRELAARARASSRPSVRPDHHAPVPPAKSSGATSTAPPGATAPHGPGVVQASASFRIRRFYSAVYVRRCGLAATCTSSATIETCASMALSRLALINNFGGRDCLTHPGTEGGAHHLRPGLPVAGESDPAGVRAPRDEAVRVVRRDRLDVGGSAQPRQAGTARERHGRPRVLRGRWCVWGRVRNGVGRREWAACSRGAGGSARGDHQLQKCEDGGHDPSRSDDEARPHDYPPERRHRQPNRDAACVRAQHAAPVSENPQTQRSDHDTPREQQPQ